MTGIRPEQPSEAVNVEGVKCMFALPSVGLPAALLYCHMYVGTEVGLN
jgi:hypothetical protein